MGLANHSARQRLDLCIHRPQVVDGALHVSRDYIADFCEFHLLSLQLSHVSAKTSNLVGQAFEDVGDVGSSYSSSGWESGCGSGSGSSPWKSSAGSRGWHVCGSILAREQGRRVAGSFPLSGACEGGIHGRINTRLSLLHAPRAWFYFVAFFLS